MDAEELMYRAPSSAGIWKYMNDTTELLMLLSVKRACVSGGVLSISSLSKWWKVS